MDHRITYGPKNVHRTKCSQDGNIDICKAATISLSLQTMTVFHVNYVLVYSQTIDGVFCFCSFNHHTGTFLADDGIDDWVHLPTTLEFHEGSGGHLKIVPQVGAS